MGLTHRICAPSLSRTLAPLREEGEKFNVWVAWMNMENAYGQPSGEEALTALFQRALQYCDQKKLYLVAVGIAERSVAGCRPGRGLAFAVQMVIVMPSCLPLVIFSVPLPLSDVISQVQAAGHGRAAA